MTDTGLFDVDDATDMTLTDVTLVGGCRNCGGDVKSIEGTMNIDRRRGIDLIAGPTWSYEVLEVLRPALQAIVADPPADPLRELAKSAPVFAEDVRAASRGMPRGQKIALLGFLLALVTGDYSNLADLAALVTDALHYVAEHGRVPGS